MRFAVSLLALLAAPAWAASACPENYAGGQPPTIVKTNLKPRTQELCFRAFAVMHSGISRGPLWSAEHLLAAEVEDAGQLTRKDSFHAEPRLPAPDRSELSDYARSGMDRGHMTPNGDMADRVSQGESFSLANIVPQFHTPNAGVWSGIEMAVRKLARENGEVYAITGPAFLGDEIKSLKGRVLIPTHTWKAVYVPRLGQAGVYVAANEADTTTYTVMPVSTFEQMVGLRVLPGVAQHIRDAGMALPPPTHASNARRTRGVPAPEVPYDLSDVVRQAIEKLLKTLK